MMFSDQPSMQGANEKTFRAAFLRTRSSVGTAGLCILLPFHPTGAAWQQTLLIHFLPGFSDDLFGLPL